MEFSTALAAQLAALGSSAVQLPDAVEELHGLLLAVVPSALGLSITVHISDVDLTLTTVPEGVQPQTSLRVPLSMWAGFETGSEIVFYASTSGSLVDLAAELGWALELNITWTKSNSRSRAGSRPAPHTGPWPVRPRRPLGGEPGGRCPALQGSLA